MYCICIDLVKWGLDKTVGNCFAFQKMNSVTLLGILTFISMNTFIGKLKMIETGWFVPKCFRLTEIQKKSKNNVYCLKYVLLDRCSLHDDYL